MRGHDVAERSAAVDDVVPAERRPAALRHPPDRDVGDILDLNRKAPGLTEDHVFNVLDFIALSYVIGTSAIN